MVYLRSTYYEQQILLIGVLIPSLAVSHIILYIFLSKMDWAKGHQNQSHPNA